jgi:hypothetical protein
MFYTVDFPTRTAIDNIFINFCRINSFKIHPTVNGLSDHDAQFLVISNVFKLQTMTSYAKKRLVTEAAVLNSD